MGRSAEDEALLRRGRRARPAPHRQADLLASVAHDLRVPLTSIREFVSIVEDGLAGPTTDRQREYLAIARRNADSLAEMIEQLLLFTRIRQQSFRLLRRRVRIGELLRDETLAPGHPPREKRVAFHVEIDPRTPDAYADPGRLLEAVRNLIDNSIKYSEASVTITVSARGVSDGSVEITVRDDGLGMDAATRRRIFRRAYRGKQSRLRSPGGLGLGLSIVKEIIDLHDGSISVRSEPGRGSEFRLRLPRYDREGILLQQVAEIWRKAARERSEAHFVRMGIRSWDGAVPLTASQLGDEIRETLRTRFRSGESLVADCDSDRSIGLLLKADRGAAEDLLGEIVSTVQEKLQLHSATRVEWESKPGWLHSKDFRHPQEMVDAILHQRCRGEE